MGSTASSKSDVAENIADQLGLSLLSADAFMVYKRLDIGTNKPPRKDEYRLIDIVEPCDEFGVGEYVVRASEVLQEFWDEQKGAVIVGGTGFYVRALVEQYDDLMPPPNPDLRAELMELQEREGIEGLVAALKSSCPDLVATVDLKNPVRVRRALERARDPRPSIKFELPPFKIEKYVLDPEGIDDAITARASNMLKSGWIEETACLLAEKIAPTAPGFRAIGYDCVIGIVQGTMSSEEAELRIVAETRQYARRQRTWLRSEPRVTKWFRGDVGGDFSTACAKEIVDACFV